MTVNLSALAGAGQQFFSDSGVPLAGGKLYSYVAGTTTPQATYTSASGSTAHSNPIVLNSAGRVATGEIWLTAGSNYKFALYTSADVLITTWDNITSINGTGIASNAENVQYDPPFSSSVSTTVEAKLAQSVSILDFGTNTVPGITDMSAALAAALQSGKPIYIPSGTYYIATAATYAGSVVMYGDGDASILTSNGNLFSASNASNSMLRDFRITRKNNPATVIRAYPNFASWTISTNGNGYMPGINDDDGAYAALTTAQKAETGTWIQLTAAANNAGAMGNNISVENISSNFGSIIIENCNNVTVRGCRLRGERASASCIWIKNYQAVALGSPKATNIVIEGNTCFNASYNPISIDGTNGAVIANNICYASGETGIKLWQDQTGDPSNRGNLHTTLTGNYCYYCYEDGYNISSRYANSNADNTYYVATGNAAVSNNSSGFVIDGNYNVITGNTAQSNALDGFTSNDWYSTYSGNFALDNNQNNVVSGRHEFVNNGENNTWIGNRVVRTGTKNGNAFYFGNVGTLSLYSNTGVGTNSEIIYPAPGIPSASLGNVGNGLPTTNSPLRPLTLQTATGTTASTNLTLGQEDAAGNSVKIVFHPRSVNNAIDPSAEILTLLGLGTPGAEDGLLYLRTVLNGTMGDKLFIDGNGDTNAGVDNTYKLGTASYRWSVVYAGNGTINTSDEREKEQIQDIDAKALKAWEKVNYVQFKFKDAVVKKGDGARWHFGLIAQRVKAAFESEGLDAFAYGLLCYDEWEATSAIMGSPGIDAEGNQLEEVEIKAATTAGNRYGIRYEQALALECAYLRSKLNG
jgi:hypothetical protein